MLWWHYNTIPIRNILCRPSLSEYMYMMNKQTENMLAHYVPPGSKQTDKTYRLTMCWPCHVLTLQYNSIPLHFTTELVMLVYVVAPWFHHRPNMLVKDTVVYRPNHGAPCTNIQGGPERICWPLTGRMDFYTPFGLGYGGLKGDSPMRKYYRHYYFIFTIWYWLKALFSISCHFFFPFSPLFFLFSF